MVDLIRAAAALEKMAQIVFSDNDIALASLDHAPEIIESIASQFHADLRNLVVLAWNSDGSILGDMRALVKQAVENAYIDGLRAGGVEDPEDVEADDAQMIDELALTQKDFVTGFVRDVRAAKNDKAAQRDILNNRIDLWTANIEAAYQAGLASAKGGELVEFGLAPGAEPSDESCTTCERLMGKRMRRKTVVAKGLLIHPGNDNYECGCWRCPHEWLPVKK